MECYMDFMIKECYECRAQGMVCLLRTRNGTTFVSKECYGCRAQGMSSRERRHQPSALPMIRNSRSLRNACSLLCIVLIVLFLERKLQAFLKLLEFRIIGSARGIPVVGESYYSAQRVTPSRRRTCRQRMHGTDARTPHPHDSRAGMRDAARPIFAAQHQSAPSPSAPLRRRIRDSILDE